MACQDDSVKLLALATLNMADDEGYFLADAALVRSFARPLDENSRNTHGALTTLCEIGWIEIKKTATHGSIGRVANFAKHQVINRPSPSKLKNYFAGESSLNIHGVLTETSVPEQGTGNREQGREHNSPLALTRKRERVKSSPDHIVKTIYEIYPRKEGRGEAYRAIEKALVRVSKEKSCVREDAGDFIYSAVAKFSESPAGKKGQYTPHCATWMNQDRFFDDPSEWWKVNTNGNSSDNAEVIRAAAERLNLESA
jgi:hypothetical protein